MKTDQDLAKLHAMIEEKLDRQVDMEMSRLDNATLIEGSMSSEFTPEGIISFAFELTNEDLEYKFIPKDSWIEMASNRVKFKVEEIEERHAQKLS